MTFLLKKIWHRNETKAKNSSDQINDDDKKN